MSGNGDNTNNPTDQHSQSAKHDEISYLKHQHHCEQKQKRPDVVNGKYDPELNHGHHAHPHHKHTFKEVVKEAFFPKEDGVSDKDFMDAYEATRTIR